MKRFINCILFITTIILLYYSIHFFYDLTKKEETLITDEPIIQNTYQNINNTNEPLVEKYDYTKLSPNIHTTTNMFQII